MTPNDVLKLILEEAYEHGLEQDCHTLHALTATTLPRFSMSLDREIYNIPDDGVPVEEWHPPASRSTMTIQIEFPDRTSNITEARDDYILS